MQVTLETDILENLSCNGVLAYLAVKMAEGTEATTAVLAGLVRGKTGNMLEGLKELSMVAPELVIRARDAKTKKLNHHWRCGVVKAGEGVALLQNLDSERFRVFVDDLKKYWDFLNPDMPFEMGGKDGMRIRQFLSDHRQWLQVDWVKALHNRALSVVKFGHASRSAPLFLWVGQLDNYAAGPLDKWNKPVEGSGNGKAFDREQRNRQGNEEYLASRL